MYDEYKPGVVKFSYEHPNGDNVVMSFNQDITSDEFVEKVKLFMLAISYHPDSVSCALGLDDDL